MSHWSSNVQNEKWQYQRWRDKPGFRETDTTCSEPKHCSLCKQVLVRRSNTQTLLSQTNKEPEQQNTYQCHPVSSDFQDHTHFRHPKPLSLQGFELFKLLLKIGWCSMECADDQKEEEKHYQHFDLEHSPRRRSMSENRYNCRMFIDFPGGSEYILSGVEFLGPHCSGNLFPSFFHRLTRIPPLRSHSSFSSSFSDYVTIIKPSMYLVQSNKNLMHRRVCKEGRKP